MHNQSDRLSGEYEYCAYLQQTQNACDDDRENSRLHIQKIDVASDLLLTPFRAIIRRPS